MVDSILENNSPMAHIRKILRSLINKTGLDIRRLKTHEIPATPVKTEGDLALYETSLGDFYLPLDAENDVIIKLCCNYSRHQLRNST